MIKKILGYLLAAVGFIGYIFFRGYKGSVIPLPTFWYFLSMAVGIIGLYLIYAATSSLSSKRDKYKRERLEKLKQNGEKILLTLQNCEVRENSYYEEVINEDYSRVHQTDALLDPNRSYKQRFVKQSAIIYYYTHAGKKIRMTSEAFMLDAVTLKEYVERENAFLYVNRFNKNDYEFDIPSPRV